MRLAILVAVATIFAPATLAAHMSAPGIANATDVSAAKKKAKKPAAKKDEYLKAAPGAGPSGPKK